MFLTPRNKPIGTGTAIGTVTSVALSAAAIFTVTGSPITSSGTIDIALATQTANRVFAGPTSGGVAVPTFRALVTADMPSSVILNTLADAKGDIFAATAADTVTRLAVGTNGHVLTADSAEATGMKWAAPAASGIQATIFDAKGDIIAASAADTAARLAVGTNGQVLSADSAEATGLKWVTVSGSGTVTTVSVVTANGVSGSVANPTTTPAITITLGAITPSAINVSGLTASLAVFTDGSKNLVSKAVTGTGNVVLSASPVFSGTITAADIDATSLDATSHVIVTGASGTQQVVGVTQTGVSTWYMYNETTTGLYKIGAIGSIGTVLTLNQTSGLATLAGALTVTGIVTGGAYNKVTITAPASSAILTIADGKTLTVSNTLTLAGTDARTHTFPTTNSTLARTDAAQTFTGVQTLSSQPILSSLTASQAVFTDGSKGLVSNAITGTGNVVMSASPTFTGTITAAIANFSGTVSVTGNVGIGQAATDNVLDVISSDGVLRIARDKITTGDMGAVFLGGKNAAGTAINAYGYFVANGTNVTAGSETGRFDIVVRYPGAFATGLSIAGSAAPQVRFPGHVSGTPTWTSGDKYLIVDATGNIHVSALGPAS